MIPAILPPTAIMKMGFPKNKFLKCIWVMEEVDIGLLRPDTITQLIAEVMIIGLLSPANLPLVILEDIIVVMLVEVDIGHISQSGKNS